MRMRGRPNNNDDNGRNSSSDDSSGSNNFYRAFRTRLQGLSFPAFQVCVTLWLRSRGFKHIRSLGRRAARGRRSNGGADLVAGLTGLPKSSVAVQIRYCRTPIQRRTVDELRGAMLRLGLNSGLIVANGWFSKAARIASREFPGRPVDLVSVDRLSHCLANLGLGIRESQDGPRLDDLFFRALEQMRFGNDRGFSITHSQTTDIAMADLTDVGPRPSQPKPPKDLDWRWWAGLALAVYLVWLLMRGR